MTELVKTSLGSFSAVGVGLPRNATSGMHTVTASVSGVGAVSASVKISGSNNLTDWTLIATLSPSGTGSAVSTASWSTDYQYWLAEPTALSGSVVDVVVSSDQTGSGALQTILNKDGQVVMDAVSKRAVVMSGSGMIMQSVRESRSKTGFTGAGAAMLNYTHHHAIALKGRFSRVRIAVHGMEAGTWPIAGCKIASLPQLAASTAVWNAATWVQVTFSGSNTANVPARQAASRPTVFWSDWIDLPAVDRTDGGAGYILAVRILDGGTAYTYLNHELANSDANLGYEVLPLGAGIDSGWRTCRQGVDGVGTIGNFTSTTDSDTALVAAVQTLTFDPVITCALFADSIGQGQRTTIAQARSWLLQAVRELSSETGLKLQCFNQAFAGRKQIDFLTTAIQYIPQAKPQLVFFPIFTGNDTLNSDAEMELYKSQTLQLLDVCNTYGSKAVIYSAPAIASFPAAANARRKALNDWAKKYASAFNYIFCDMDAVLSQDNGDGTSQLIAAFASAVPPHPNDAGYAVMVPPAKAAIRSALWI